MLDLTRIAGPKAAPERRTAVVARRRGSLAFRYAVGAPDTYLFTVDTYRYNDYRHPDGHLGWWRFELPPGRGRATLEIDFGRIDAGSIRVTAGGRRLPATDHWCNPGCALDPLGDLLLVMRTPAGEIRRIEPVLLKFVDRDVLRAFYERQYRTHGYTPPNDAPFRHELHAYKLRRLRELFTRYVPGGRVVDVGCGRSLFTEIETAHPSEDPFPFTVYAGDLNFDSVRDRAAEIHHQKWAVFDAAALPFRDERFDALFAGEVIEHVPDVRAALGEWRRVLKPGGMAIVTTPNRERLVALANGMECPCSPDHLSELSYRELTRDLLPEAGFEFVAQSCAHLELWMDNLLNRRRVEDFLDRRGNTRRHLTAMRRLLPLGRWFPWVALQLVVAARRK